MLPHDNYSVLLLSSVPKAVVTVTSAIVSHVDSPPLKSDNPFTEPMDPFEDPIPESKMFRNFAEPQIITQLVFLSLSFLIGVPVNSIALVLLARKHYNRATRMTALQIHRSVADLIVLLVYIPTQIYYEMLMSKEFAGSLFTCKLFKYARHFSFQLSSNVTVCIALDRLHAIRNLGALVKTWTTKRLQVMLLMAWCIAALLSSPILHLVEVRHISNETLCTLIWIPTNMSLIESYLNSMPLSERLWTLFHLVAQFWIPALIIAVVYHRIWKKLHDHRRKSMHVATHSDTQQLINITPFTTSTAASSTNNYSRAKRPSEGNCVPRHHRFNHSIRLRRHRTYHGRQTNNWGLQQGLTLSAQSHFSVITSDTNNASVSPARPSIASLCSGRSRADSRRFSKESNSSNANRYSGTNRMTWLGLRASSSAMRRAVLITSAYILFWFPYSTLSFWQFFHRHSYVKHINIGMLYTLIVLNSVINPWLYGTAFPWRIQDLCRKRPSTNPAEMPPIIANAKALHMRIAQ